MSSQPSSSKEAMVLNPLSPPKPPENLALHLQGGKVIFFTLNTLFDRDHATERGLEKCRQLNQDLRNKPMEELKRGYHGAMVAAYRQLLRSQVHGSAPRGFHPSSIPQVSVDKVGMLFQQLDLNPPPASERQLIGREFAGEFSRNRFEVRGASRCLGELKQLKYAIVVVDDVVEWDVVKHLNFWHYIDALITSADPTVRKPDSRVFQKALDVCRVSPKNAVIIGSSVDDDIVGIMEVSAEPILYNPSQNYALVEVKGRRVLVIRTMAELVSEIRSRPENRGLVQYQQQQLHPVTALPVLPAHPPMVYAPQDQGYLDDRNGESSGPSQSQHPSSDQKPGYLDDGHVNQPRERSRPSPALSEPDSSDETPRSHGLPKVQDRDRSIKDFERDVRLAPPLNRVPSKRRRDESVIQGTSLPTNPQVPPRHDQGHLYYAAMGEYNGPARGSFHGASTQGRRPPSPKPATVFGSANDHHSPGIHSTSHPLMYRRWSPSPPRLLPRITPYPPTEGYGISSPHDAGYQDQQRSWHSGRDYEVSGSTYPTRDQYQAETASPYQTSHEPRSRTLSQQIGPSPGVFDGPWRDGSARRTASMSEGDVHRPWETRNTGPSSERTWERLDELRRPRPEERSMDPYRREVTDLTSVSRNAEPSDPARAFAAAGPFFPNRPFPLPSHGFSNRTHPDRRAPSRAESPEQLEAGPSNQQPSSSRHEETAARGGRRAEMLMSCIMCSEVRPTLHGSASQSQFPDDAAARPSGQHQRTTPGLRVFAQSALDLG
ncbi:Glyceraldehyde 3-phosphate phosphatase [Fusarium oxysporum f. sp. rapae]|uniref:Glyceraldehyde 3-phosphate phosphatase n=1 Tax=Fusarium oxysporum f. sp. rapae TaxID=485398 RepID=A0A8J5TUA8_FUSOX|nr:Glyceraldehyde 3-phosphate phosphatase [Fusarium oxysporum f. sp. rapae]